MSWLSGLFGNPPSARPSRGGAQARASISPFNEEQAAPGGSSLQGCTTKTIGGVAVRVANERLSSEAAIASSVSFVRTLVAEINLTPGLYSHICPVEVATNTKKVAIICDAKMAESEEMAEVLRSLHRKGFQMADGLQPNFFICEVESLVLAVSKGHLTGEESAKRKRVLGKGSEGNLWRTFTDIVSWAVQNDASDIHININELSDRSQIKFTIDGLYVEPEMFSMPTKLLSAMAGVAYQQSKGGNGSDFLPLVEQQCCIHLEVKGRSGQSERIMLRWASMATDAGPQITLRILRLYAEVHAHTLESLEYMPSQQAMAHRAMLSRGGAIIASGILGQGKSTLLAALMSSIPSTRKVFTFEDPVEYIIPRAHQNTIARSLDKEDDSVFLAKIRTSKRGAFHDLMIGEIRDRQTGQAFQDVIVSGLNVYTTVHAGRHILIPDRLADPSIGVGRHVLATPGHMKLLVAQVLLPANCPECSIPASQVLRGAGSFDGRDVVSWTSYFQRLHRLFALSPEGVRLRNPSGCAHCSRAGLPELAGCKGRIVAAEMIEPDDTFLALVRDGQNIELEQYVEGLGHTPLTDPNADNKSALEVALYHMHCGRVDPRDIEPCFESFETMELRRHVKRRSGLKAVA